MELAGVPLWSTSMLDGSSSSSSSKFKFVVVMVLEVVEVVVVVVVTGEDLGRELGLDAGDALGLGIEMGSEELWVGVGETTGVGGDAGVEG